MFLEVFLASLLSLVVYAAARRTVEQVSSWAAKRLLKRKLMRLGVKPEDGHYFHEGICMICKMPEAIYRMPGNEGRFVHPDPFKDW
jgi:hypothetical protein